MIPPAKKSPSALALDIVAGAPAKKSSSPYGDEYGGGDDEDAPPDDEAPAEDPESLLNKIQSNIDQLRASL